jgi:hypothetical protein
MFRFHPNRSPLSPRISRVAFGLRTAFALAVTILIVARTTRAQDDPKQPTTKPASNDQQITQWFIQLASGEPRAREQARVNMMGLRKTDLPALLEVVRRAPRLAPSQRSALHDIVMQVYLSGEPYQGNRQIGFLGVRLGENSWAALLQAQQQQQQQLIAPAPQPQQRQKAAAGDENKDDEETANAPPLGVVITDRLPGFSSFRMFRDGDVVIGCDEQPRFEIRGSMDLKTVVGTSPAGTVLHFHVFRGGRLMTVPVMLHARPGTDNGLDFDFTLESERRVSVAEDYWQKTFAPVVKDADDDDGPVS